MVSADAARNIVGIIGNVISFGLFLSPVPTFWKIYKKKDVEEFKADPYLATLLNCMLWIRLINPMSFVRAAEGALLPRRRGGVHGDRGALRAAHLHTHEKRSMIVGILCIIFGTMMYASPLTVMGKVIKTKSTEYMPFLLSLVNFCNGCCWTAYALIKFDLYITIPNGLGALFGLAQLVLYACYCGSTPKKNNGKNVEMPTVGNTNTVGGGNVTVTVER
ncbi:hypothetical protein ACQ4PT_065030 [Festuca glaucescens]